MEGEGRGIKKLIFFNGANIPDFCGLRKVENLRMSQWNDLGAHPTPIRFVPTATPPFDRIPIFTPIFGCVPKATPTFDQMPRHCTYLSGVPTADHAFFWMGAKGHTTYFTI
jgi:hypothetical protein